jgi:hypothetical protein
MLKSPISLAAALPLAFVLALCLNATWLGPAAGLA